MAGFSLSEEFKGRIPCPHCGSTDCCGVTKDLKHVICCQTNKRVTDGQLRASAISSNMERA